MSIAINSKNRKIRLSDGGMYIVDPQRALSHRKKQVGVVAIEFALVFLLGLLPLLFVTFSGVLLFAVKQSLTLAADNGARAALQYQATTTNAPCQVAAQSMLWLLSTGSAACSATGIGDSIVITAPHACKNVTESAQCVSVTTVFDFVDSPFTLGLGDLYPSGFKSLTSTAVVQLAATGT